MFPKCKFIKDSHTDKLKIESQKEKVENLLEQLEAAENHLAILKTENVEEQIKKYEALIKVESELQVDKTRKESDIRHSESNIRSVSERISRAKGDLRDLESKMVDANVDAELSSLKSQLHTLQQEISQCDAKRIASASRVGKLESNLDTLRSEKEKYQELKRKWRIYDLFIQGVSKRGIPLQIITAQLPIINAEIAKILQGVVSFTVELEADSNSNSMDVFINYGDSRRIIEVASGMEKMIASLAIRVALINVSSLPKTDIFIIDEGFGVLDDVNIESCNRLLISLKKWFNTILIITHIDGIKDVVDNVIDITWNGKDAKVIYE
jgi:exonuclease SbcC